MAIEPMADPDETLIRGTAAEIAVANTGAAVLFSPADSPEEGIELDLRWAPRGGQPRSFGQRVRLARTLYPRERLVMPVPLMPPTALEDAGPWELHVAPVRSDGKPVALVRPCTLRVVPER